MANEDRLAAHLALAKRNVFLLSGAQAIMGAAGPLSFSVGALAGYDLLGPDKSLATAPVTGFNIGAALGAVLVAFASRSFGKKAGFILGSVLCMAGGALAAIALFRGNFWLFATGLMLTGMSGGFTQKIRFVAADLSPSFYKPKAISWILAGGIISAIIGPQLAIWATGLFFPVMFAGAFIALVPLGLAGAIVFSLVKFPDAEATAGDAGPARPLLGIITQQRFLTGMICGIGSFVLMTFMMTGAPLAMVIGCGFSTDMATLGIQWHVMAMFGPSFFTGMLISRFGAEKVVAAGFVILMACGVVAHAGIELWNFWLSLVLLGIGWNFGFIGSTAIVSSCYRPAEADKVQGFHDIVLLGCVAMASFASGKVFYLFGWSVMQLAIWPVTVICLALVIRLKIDTMRRAA